MYFDKPGKINTEQTLKAAKEKAEELKINEVVVASTSGDTAYKALDIFPEYILTIVTYHCGFRKPFESIMASHVKEDLISKGASVISATHALSGVERGIAKKHSGVYPALLIADTLRLFGQGTKVAVEIAVMATDAGALTGNDIISIGGSAKGSDTALVIKPAGQSVFLDMKIREIICKPRIF
mmetsp:Transcript_14634/g.7150  ORF Transcript_14634/g.7150 Transcript_14634/m.7150 type:complete len:183 (-) Transcript_14634:429-977(-)